MQILSALESSPVSRLKKTWQEVGNKYATILRELKEVFSFEKNSKNYRRILDDLDEEPCIPFLAITLQDLTFVDENESFISKEDGTVLINFEKCLLQSKIISKMISLQKKNLSISRRIQHYYSIGITTFFDRTRCI